MENELFSMLLTSMEQNSFQNVVPDIANNSNPLLNTSTPDIVCTKPMMSLPKSHHAHYTHQLEDYPLDMQFPKGGKEKAVPSTTNNKKRKLKTIQDELKEEKEQKEQKKVKLDGDAPNYSEDEKRQKRLEKNREAAHMFRQRQKVYINDLEKKVNEYTLENQHFKSKIELLTTENRLLNDQLSYLRNFMANVMSRSDQAPMLTSMFHSFQSGSASPSGNLPTSSPLGSHSRMLNAQQHHQQQQQHHAHSNYQTNGVSSFSYANPTNSYKLYTKDSN